MCLGRRAFTTGSIIKVLHFADHHKVSTIYCSDEKTELLSKRGWLNHDQVKETDYIWTIDENLNAKWSKVQEVFKKEVDMEMEYIHSSRFSSLTTPNHRWLVHDNKGLGDIHFVESKDLFKWNRLIPIAAQSVSCLLYTSPSPRDS